MDKSEAQRAFIDIVFDGPPSHESGRFVEVENEHGASIRAGEWIDRGDGLWALRIIEPFATNKSMDAALAEIETAIGSAATINRCKLTASRAVLHFCRQKARAARQR